MSIVSAIADTMEALGHSPEHILKVLRAVDSDQDKAEKARTANAERQARFRAKNNVTNEESNVTEPSSLLPSPTPPTNNSSPQSSLRSVSNRARETFDRFFAVFPKRINRKSAFARWKTAIKAGVDPERMIDAATRYAEYVKFTEPQFIKAPDTWLNAGKYDDELPIDRPNAPPARAGPRQSGDPWGNAISEIRENENAKRDHEVQSANTGRAEPRDREPRGGLFESAGASSGGDYLDLRPFYADARR